jgi:hypothetical protein
MALPRSRRVLQKIYLTYPMDEFGYDVSQEGFALFSGPQSHLDMHLDELCFMLNHSSWMPFMLQFSLAVYVKCTRRGVGGQMEL